MNLEFEELYNFVKARPEDIYEADGNIKSDYEMLSKKIKEASFNNPDYTEIINSLRLATTDNELEQVRNLFNTKFMNKCKTIKKQQKVYIKKSNYKNGGFMDSILLALITGFAGGIITMIVYNIIK